MTISVEQLRVGVSFAHAVPAALLTLRLDRGRSLRCTHDQSLEPDLHPCQARRLLANAYGGGPADWVNEVVGLELGGPRLADFGGGLYRAELEDCLTWSFATTLCPLDAHDLVEAALGELFADHGVPLDDGRIASLDLRAHIDQSLGVVIVSCAESEDGPVPAAEAARRSLEACLVGELCSTSDRQRGLR
jgi:hypothetical protein